MDSWIGLVGALIGTILGGVLTVVVGRYQAQDADRRLRIQQEHADQQREQDRRTAISNESAEHLGTLIKTITEALPSITKSTSETEMDEAVFKSWASATQRAAVSMTAIGDKDALDAVKKVNQLVVDIFAAEDIGAATVHLNQVTGALAMLDRHYMRLKLGDSQQG